MAFELPALPYAYTALEPHIDAQTMEIHHSKHHQAYINNLNKALETEDLSVLKNDYSIENILAHSESFQSMMVRNNAGGHYNHTLFWKLMKPNGGGEPKGTIVEAINKTFGTFDDFKKKFTDQAMKHFGSGWAWLTVNKDSKALEIWATPNQDNPLMPIKQINGKPILALDVWEHAYYLKNQNRRADYIASWWNVVNWEEVEKLFTSK